VREVEEINGKIDWQEDQSAQLDNVGEYKRDQFLQFGQNNDIDMHFTL